MSFYTAVKELVLKLKAERNSKEIAPKVLYLDHFVAKIEI